MRAVTVALMIGALGLPSTALESEAAATSVVLEVKVRSNADISTDALRRAQAVVTRIYRLAGVSILWREPDPLPAGQTNIAATVSVSLLPQPLPEYVAMSEEMMGMAPRGEVGAGRLAYVFYDRVEWFSRFFNADVGLVLGHVVAHEIGHLLLPYPSHSASGLMKATWVSKDFQDLSRGAFLLTQKQSDAIRETLETSKR